MRALCNGKTSAFQADDAGSIPAARSSLFPIFDGLRMLAASGSGVRFSARQSARVAPLCLSRPAWAFKQLQTMRIYPHD